MPALRIEHLDRQSYRASVDAIDDPSTRRFAEMSMQWWDRHFSWKAQGCAVLSNEQDEHLCYLFYKIDRYGEYITFHNIFTPGLYRRHGYAKALLGMVFMLALGRHVSRFRITSISRALDFYLPLGFAYWGVNGEGDYYCDLPLPAGGLDGLDTMIRQSDTATLIGPAAAFIEKKTGGNESRLNAEQTLTYEADVHKMGRRFMHDDFIAFSA